MERKRKGKSAVAWVVMKSQMLAVVKHMSDGKDTQQYLAQQCKPPAQ
jgi:hypothetical protein